MKKAHINIKINIPDDFEPGKCNHHCPFANTIEHETSYQQYETIIKCNLGFSRTTCPIELNEEVKSNWGFVK